MDDPRIAEDNKHIDNGRKNGRCETLPHQQRVEQGHLSNDNDDDDNDEVEAEGDFSIPPSPTLSFPLNYLYVISQFIILLSLLPYDATYYSIFPRKRSRSSWTLLDQVFLKAVKRYLKMIDKAGFKISNRNVFKTPNKGFSMWMSGCKFEWIEERVDRDLVKGTIIDDESSYGVFMRNKVGIFSWYRNHKGSRRERSFGTREKNLNCHGLNDDEQEGAGLVGLYFHGGAFTHNSAHPKSQSTVMPMTIFNRDKRFVSMHSVEFRLLPEFPFPAQLQDAVTVYISFLKTRGILPKNIVLIGDSSGANIVLSLTRWIRDTLNNKPPHLTMTPHSLSDPGGLILFSPWIDPSHSFLDTLDSPRSYIRRKNSCDYILEKGEFRHHLVHNLLGSSKRPRSFVLSPYLSPGRLDLPFSSFDRLNHPPTFVSYGTGERGQEECERFLQYLKRDLGGTDEEFDRKVKVVVTKDTPHDVLLLGFWKREQREMIWRGVLDFLKEKIKVKHVDDDRQGEEDNAQSV